ncbi:UDP-glucose iridoid glucosyltransferase-like [Coffea eugenioides]|uniref:UDP-glucose iridoid glucosyltransferase-like n=1 Tax=Coffea eugenioides TaxID=49369 RepID=UPI000F60C42F|nr:UDP-glucose iridoid glucosyltransferase-like [Coffea eugenioides]
MAILRDQRRSVVLVPYPYQGHITPMLQLGEILHSGGFSVIVAHTKFNSPNPLNHPEFFFLPLKDNLSGFDTSFGNTLAVIRAINENCRAPLQGSLAQMMKDQEKHGQVCCIIHDAIMHFGRSVANHLNISSLVLGTCSALYMQVYPTILQLQSEHYFPLQDSKMLEPVPGLGTLRFKDFAIPANIEIPQPLLKFYEDTSNLGSSVGIILNTTEELDPMSLSELKQYYKVPLFTIGPFHKMAPTSSSSSFLKEDRSCMAWLDKQAPQSVLYLSLGSLASIEAKELEETAWGLANSGQPFLWVVRPSSVNGSEWIEQLPKGFQDAVGERGHIVQWAPQKEVLAHSAVGGFFTHCGWNSILESLCEAGPMICRPCFADQLANARYLTHVWKVGLELELVEDRGVIERAIKRLMVENEGKEMRQRAADMKQKLDISTNKGGSSHKSLSDLIDFINSFAM